MGWGLIEMTGGFFTVGLVTILISGLSGNESMKTGSWAKMPVKTVKNRKVKIKLRIFFYYVF